MSTLILVVQVVAERVWARRRDYGEALVVGFACGLLIAAGILVVLAYGKLGR